MNNQAVSLKSVVVTRKTPSKQKAINCIFPYYRSSGCCRDSVLVKDIGITCELLKVTNVCENHEKPFNIELFNTKRVRSDYSTEYLSITRRISSYTREMLNNLTMKISKKNNSRDKKLSIQKIPIATEYSDENGQPGLKLRLKNTDSDDKHDESKHIIMDSLDKSPERHSDENLQVIFPPVLKNRDNTTTPSTFSMESYLNTSIGNKSSKGGITMKKSHRSPGFIINQKSRPAAANLNECWSGINLNTVIFRMNKHKRKH